jgi:hypothetical protein
MNGKFVYSSSFSAGSLLGRVASWSSCLDLMAKCSCRCHVSDENP